MLQPHLRSGALPSHGTSRTAISNRLTAKAGRFRCNFTQQATGSSSVSAGPPPSPSSGRSSLVADTLREMDADVELREHLATLAQVGQQAMTREEKLQRQRSLDGLGMPSFARTCQERGVAPLLRSPATIFQINIGLYCNQACTHCHVESSPRRSEAMDRATVERCLAVMAASPSLRVLDITGGAPEFHPDFRYLVSAASKLGLEVIDRCNLTVLLEPGHEDLPQFLAQHKVRVVASLPCYSASNVDKQRGNGVFERSIEGLKLLNAVGYGVEGSGLALDLVYNPGGASLAPNQAKLEAAYKSELAGAYGVHFSRLLALNNMPIKRFADFLVRRGQMDAYMKLLVDSFNPGAGAGLMCRDTVSVRWDGKLFDCDFNQQLALGGSRSIVDVATVDELTGKPILVDNHCFGCTAGSGSSCQGAVGA